MPSLYVNGDIIPDAHEQYFDDSLDNIVICLIFIIVTTETSAKVNVYDVLRSSSS